MMAELTRSRNPSENSDEKDFLAKLKRCDSSEDKANLKIKAKPLKSGNGLQIFLTREDDPGFYYSVDITDEDYRELRIRQGLLVELSAFPPMIFRLLDTCIAEEHTETPKFFPILEFSDARGDEVNFEIQEINLYRKLAHLSLKLRKGNDAKVREHLADCLKNLKLQHNLTLKTLEETSDTLKEIQEEKTRALTDLDKQKRDFCERDSLYKSRLSQEINEERERAAKHVAEMRLSYDAERRRLVEDHAATLRTLENRVAALDYDNRDLAEKKHKHEALIQRLKEESKNMTEENKRLRSEVEQHRLEKENLGQGNHELDRNLSRLQARLDVLEQDKIRLGEDLKRRDENVEDLMNMRKHLEQELSEKKCLVTKRENAVKNVSQELLKANEVIRKLQDQNRKENHKIKLGCQIVQEQEKVLTDKELELENTRKQLKEKSELIDSKEESIKDLEVQLEQIRENADEMTKKLKTNETVIQWLNKQLTTAQARDPGLRLGPPPAGINFSATAISTSTPLGSRPPLKEKNNKGLDPKYLEPSPSLANLSRKTTSKPSGLLRRNLSSGGQVQSPPPQSVYFAKT